VSAFNSLSLKLAKCPTSTLFSPNSINTQSRGKVTRINKNNYQKKNALTSQLILSGFEPGHAIAPIPHQKTIQGSFCPTQRLENDLKKITNFQYLTVNCT